MREELKPCPFCGSEDIEPNHNYGALITSTDCNNCEASTSTDEEWNARASQWISVEDRLPEDNSPVIACDSIAKKSVLASFHHSWWGHPYILIGPVTHWQPLPAPPK